MVIKALLALALMPNVLSAAGDQESGVNKAAPDRASRSAMEKRFAVLQEANDEKLRRFNPEAYARWQEEKSRNAEIQKIILQARRSEITEKDAERKLKPLVKETMTTKVERIDARIACLESQLAFLKKAQDDPSVIVEQRVKELLGKAKERTDGPCW